MVDVAPLMVLSQMLVGVLCGVVVMMDPEKERKVEDKCFRQPFVVDREHHLCTKWSSSSAPKNSLFLYNKLGIL